MNINLKNSIHIFLAHKGGVGKTTLAALLAEWMLNKGDAPIVYDADARNLDACIAQYKALNARRLDSLLVKHEDGTERISEVGFEALLESLVEEEGPHLVDTGANSYTNWVSYVQELGMQELMEEAARTVFIHTIVAGGEMCEETVRGLEEIAEKMPNWKIVLWVNEFNSPAKLRGGEHFLESAPFVALSHRLQGFIRMPEVSAVTRDALDLLGPMRLLVSEVKGDQNVSTQKRMAYGSWARKAFAALDVTFGDVNVAPKPKAA